VLALALWRDCGHFAGGSFMRLYVRRNQYQKRNPLSIALFWGEAVIVLRRALESMASSGN
jgi:hypothetical protein